jgi:heptosyltransferase-2
MKKKVLIIHTWGIGDWLMITPVIENILQRYSSDKILVLACSNSVSKFINQIYNINAINIRDPSNAYLLPKIFFRKYDLFYAGAGYNLNKYLLISNVVRSDKKLSLKQYASICDLHSRKHRMTANVSLYNALDVDIIQEDYFIPNKLCPKDVDLCIHVGSDSNQAFKRWPIYHWQDLLGTLIKSKPELVIKVILGPAESQFVKFFSEIADVVICPSYPELIGVISRARLLVSSDSGIAHLASSLNTLTATIFGATDYNIFKPYKNNILIKGNVLMSCQPCVPFGIYGCDLQPCMTSILPDYVAKRVIDLLNLP